MRLTACETTHACLMSMTCHDAVFELFDAKSEGIGLLGKCGELIRMVSCCTNRCMCRAFLRGCAKTGPHSTGSVRRTDALRNHTVFQ